MTAAALPVLSVEDLLRAQGAEPGRSGPRQARLTAIAEEALAIASAAVTPASAWSWREVTGVHPGRVQLAGAAPLRHPALAAQLAGATRVAAAALTLGPGLEQRMAREAAARPSLGLALDACGSLLLMRLATALRSSIAAGAEALGLTAGAYLAPGMPGWPVVPGQGELLGLIVPAPAGLSLTSHGMLVPGKSLTFLLGAGPALTPGGAPCECCDRAPRCNHRQPA